MSIPDEPPMIKTRLPASLLTYFCWSGMMSEIVVKQVCTGEVDDGVREDRRKTQNDE